MGERFKGRLSVDVPQGWFVKESITILAGDGQANVITSSEPLDPTTTTEKFARDQGDLLRAEFPGFHELAFEETPLLGGHRGYFRRFTWNPPDGQPVLQMQIYFVESGRGYTSTATLVSTAVEHEATVVDVLRSIQLTA